MKLNLENISLGTSGTSLLDGTMNRPLAIKPQMKTTLLFHPD